MNIKTLVKRNKGKRNNLTASIVKSIKTAILFFITSDGDNEPNPPLVLEESNDTIDEE